MERVEVLGLLVRGAVFLAAAFAVDLALRRRSASLRHALWSATFAALLLLPLAARITLPVTAPLPELADFASSTVERGPDPAAAPAAAPRVTSSPSPAASAVPDIATLLVVAWLG